MKDASFREEHFCHWEFRYIFPHYRVILILSTSSHSRVILSLVRKPEDSFWLWCMVLLAYLSDDSLMWANFQVYMIRCVFSRGSFLSLRTFALSPPHYTSYIDSRERAIGDFLIMIHVPSSLFIWRLVDVSWFSESNERWARREEHFGH